MDEGTGYRIRRRAFELWELAGRPEGKDRHFWKLAEEGLSRDASESSENDRIGDKATPTGSFAPDRSK